MKIEIEYKTIKVPTVIKVDGIIYPNHQRNWDIIKEYNETKDESVLKKLVDFSLDLS